MGKCHGCGALWPGQRSSLDAGPCDYGNSLLTFATFRYFPPAEFWFAVHIFLYRSGPSLENCSCYLYMIRSEDNMEQYSIFSKIFHILQKATVSFAVLGSPLFPALCFVPNSADGCLWVGYCLQLLPPYLSIRPDTGDSCVPTSLPRGQGHKGGLETPPGEFAEDSLNIPAWKYPL